MLVRFHTKNEIIDGPSQSKAQFKFTKYAHANNLHLLERVRTYALKREKAALKTRYEADITELKKEQKFPFVYGIVLETLLQVTIQNYTHPNRRPF